MRLEKAKPAEITVSRVSNSTPTTLEVAEPPRTPHGTGPSTKSPLTPVEMRGKSEIIFSGQSKDNPNCPTFNCIRMHLPKHSQLASWTLVFSMREHGASFVTFLQNAAKFVSGNILLVETSSGDKFGAYFSDKLIQGWSGSQEDFVFRLKDDDCVVCNYECCSHNC